VQEPTAAALELAQSLKTPLKASDSFGIERLKLLLLSQGPNLPIIRLSLPER